MKYLILLLVPVLILAGGCATTDSPHPAHALQSSPATNTTTLTTTAIEVRYTSGFNSERLTPQQLNEVLAEAREADEHAGRAIWFVLVRSNYSHNGSSHYRATVYFVPSERTPRIRHGQCTTIGWNFSVETEREIRQMMGTKRSLEEYVQVSPPDQPFDQALKVPDDAQLPFFPPENISDADLIAIVDAARRVHDANSSFRSQPVCGIETENVTHLRVMFGHQNGPLAGGGTFVTVYKTPTGYQADSTIGGWES